MEVLEITYEGIDYEAHYEYQPEEKETWGAAGGNPPVHEQASIYHLICDDVDCVGELDLDEVEEVILDKIKNYSDEY